MITKKRRGISRSEVSELFKGGKKSAFPGGVFLWRKKTGQVGRISISIARKIAPTSPIRAKIRRRIQAALYKQLPKLRDVDVVVVWTGPAQPDVHKLDKIFSEMVIRLGISE